MTLDAKGNEERFLVAENQPGQQFAVPIVFAGQKELTEKLSQIDRLTRIVLNDARIEFVGPKGELTEKCPSMYKCVCGVILIWLYTSRF